MFTKILKSNDFNLLIFFLLLLVGTSIAIPIATDNDNTKQPTGDPAPPEWGDKKATSASSDSIPTTQQQPHPNSNNNSQKKTNSTEEDPLADGEGTTEELVRALTHYDSLNTHTFSKPMASMDFIEVILAVCAQAKRYKDHLLNATFSSSGNDTETDFFNPKQVELFQSWIEELPPVAFQNLRPEHVEAILEVADKLAEGLISVDEGKEALGEKLKEHNIDLQALENMLTKASDALKRRPFAELPEKKIVDDKKFPPLRSIYDPSTGSVSSSDDMPSFVRDQDFQNPSMRTFLPIMHNLVWHNVNATDRWGGAEELLRKLDALSRLFLPVFESILTPHYVLHLVLEMWLKAQDPTESWAHLTTKGRLEELVEANKGDTVVDMIETAIEKADKAEEEDEKKDKKRHGTKKNN
eukprot:Nk52_evm15s2402 gene=Nk52_evmTU15s2402